MSCRNRFLSQPTRNARCQTESASLPAPSASRVLHFPDFYNFRWSPQTFRIISSKGPRGNCLGTRCFRETGRDILHRGVSTVVRRMHRFFFFSGPFLCVSHALVFPVRVRAFSIIFRMFSRVQHGLSSSQVVLAKVLCKGLGLSQPHSVVSLRHGCHCPLSP